MEDVEVTELRDHGMESVALGGGPVPVDDEVQGDQRWLVTPAREGSSAGGSNQDSA